MANLELIKNLNKKYNKQSPFTEITKSFSLNEYDTFNIEKSIQNSINNLGSNYTKYFINGCKAELVLLFIDICDFSTKQSHLEGDNLSRYFDEYYDLIIPIIYKYGGEIDKIIGDGIISIFGPPFLNNDIQDNIRNADKCAKEIIEKTRRTKFESKIAFHKGKINYFQNKSGFYNELTIIGKPLTELFRLESVSENNRINYLAEYRYYTNWYEDIISNSSSWGFSEKKEITLKGVDFKYIQTNKYIWD